MKSLSQPKLDKEVDPAVKPGDDFFSYVNGNWKRANPIPPDKSRWGAFMELRQENTERLHELLKSDAQSTSPTACLVKQFFRAGMDEAKVAATTPGFVAQRLGEIEQLTSIAAVQAYVARSHAAGLGLLWSFNIAPDDKDSSRYILRFHQDGLGLPDRDYYLEDDDRLAKVRQAYQKFLMDLFELLKLDNPAGRAKTVYELEHQLAQASFTATENRDALKIYNAIHQSDLSQRFAGWDWSNYLGELGLGQISDVIVSQPPFIKAVSQLMVQIPVADWRSYLTAHTLIPLMTKLSKPFEELHFNFYQRTLQGVDQPEPRYRRLIQLCEAMLPEPTGQLYVEAYFDETAKKAIYDLVDGLQTAFRARIERLDWMTTETKAKAQQKLSTFLPLLGYPDKWKTYAGLDLGDCYAANFLAVQAYETRRELSKIGQPVDRREWLMSPATVNAYYWPNTNGITFPAGILQWPFFDAGGDVAANYGGIGAVIGHEISHGFDDQGALFDYAGNMRQWWTKADRQKFDTRAEGLKQQYDDYEIDGRHVNGALTLGENIADLGGVEVALEALKLKLGDAAKGQVDGFSPAQRFFLGYARTERGTVRPEAQLIYLISDPHSPHQFRVNGVVRNCDDFYEAFGVKPGDALYLAPDQRVKIW